MDLQNKLSWEICGRAHKEEENKQTNNCSEGYLQDALKG
jgi:hypothetical protein